MIPGVISPVPQVASRAVSPVPQVFQLDGVLVNEGSKKLEEKFEVELVLTLPVVSFSASFMMKSLSLC